MECDADQGDLAEAVSELKQQNGQDLLIYGSSQLVNRLAQSNLIDEYRLMVFLSLWDAGSRCSWMPAASSTYDLGAFRRPPRAS